MAGFPMFVELAGRRCLVVGGGSVALRKMNTLLQFDADVRVYAREADPCVRQLAEDGKITLTVGEISLTGQEVSLPDQEASQLAQACPSTGPVILPPADANSLLTQENAGVLGGTSGAAHDVSFLDGAFLVICATDDAELNHEIARLCRERHIPVNSATGTGDSTFIFPSVIVRDDITVGISTSGQAPALSRHIRQELETALPEWYGVLGQRLAAYRVRLGGLCGVPAVRGEIMKALMAYGLSHGGEVPEAVFLELLERVGGCK